VPSLSDPFAVEERFQAVFSYLQASSATARWRTIQSIERLPPPRPRAEPYVLELAGPLYEQVQRVDPVGTTPERLEAAAKRLGAWQVACPDLQDLPEWQDAIDALTRRAAHLYVFAGDPVRAARTLMRQADAPSGLVPVFDLPGQATRTAITRAFLESVEVPSRVSKVLRSALRDLQEQEGGVDIPVVESPVQAGSEDRIGGRIRLRVTQEREFDASSPAHAVRIAGVDFLGTRHIGTVEQALHAVLTRERRGDEQLEGGRAYEVTVASRHGQALINGTSFQLGLGGLVLSRVVSRQMPRLKVQMARGVGVTGRLTLDGEGVQVDPRTLTTKVETAFFSPMRTLAVPYGQEAAADAALRPLRQQFPHGELHIVGVRSLMDILDRRRLTQRVEISRVQHATSQARANKGALVGFALALLLLSALVYVLTPPVDQTPVRGTYSGSLLKLENRKGQTIEEIAVGAEIVNSIQSRNRSRSHALLSFGPSQDAGVVWAASSTDQGEVIRARSMAADTLLWERAVDVEVMFPEKPFANTSDYYVEAMYAADTRGGPADEIYASLTHSPYFPSVLVEIDAQTGTFLQQYVHPGHLTSRIQSMDLDEDGDVELITGGYSNAFNSPALLALHAEGFSGHAPATSAYTADGVPDAHHHAYLRLPATPVQEAAPKTFRVVRRAITREGHIRVQVEDGTFDDRLVSDSELFVRFDKRLRPVSVAPSSQYDRLAERLVEEGRLDSIPGPEAFQTYMDEIRYWNGKGWQNGPASADPRSASLAPSASLSSTSKR